MKLYQDENGLVVLLSPSADQHTIIDNVLPPALKGCRAENADLEQFLYMLHIALAPPGFMDGAKGATKANPAEVAIPPIDEGHFHLVEGGEFQHERLRVLAKIVGYRWHQPPPPGLIWNFVSEPADYESLERKVELYEQSKGKPKDETLDFIELMLPPEFKGISRVMTSSETDEVVHTLLFWVLKTPPAKGQAVDRHVAINDLQELKIRGINGQLDRRRAKLAAKFIWSANASAPSFANLKTWLFAQDRREQKLVEAKTAALRKKRKVARKRSRKGRR